MLIEDLPQPPHHVSDVGWHTRRDLILSRVLNWAWKGWLLGRQESDFKPLNSSQHELSGHKGFLLWGNRVIIPSKLQQKVLEALHIGHLGIVRMNALVCSYCMCGDPEWTKKLRDGFKCTKHVKNLGQLCSQALVQHWEMTKTLWSKLHIEFAGPFQGQVFLIVVDSYSKWLEVVLVSSMTLAVVIGVLRRDYLQHMDLQHMDCQTL